MMKANRIALLVLAVLIGSNLPLGAATPPKFRPSGSGDSGTGRYVITLTALTADAGAEDIAAMKRELPLLYGAALEGNPSDVRQFTVTMTPARARLLSTDPRVSEVAEAPPASTPAAPTPTPVSQARHFTTQPSGYGDNGQSGTYTYDSSGNITAIGTDTYLYDLEERLSVSVTRGVTETYVYDAFGNRKSATGAVNCLGQTTCAQPVTLDEHTNRLQTINTAAVQYDTAGNVTTIAGTPSTTYTYDGTGMMIEQTVGSDDRQFVYTADDERIAVRQGLSWTWTVRDPSQKVVREFTSLETPNSGFAMTNRQWLKDYVWRDGLLLATTTSSGTLHYHLDHLGTPRLVTDGSGAKVAEHAYYPFGAEIALSPHETPEEAMKFTGHERDIVAGDGHTLDYMHARYYNDGMGKFLEVDPLLGDPGGPQTWNRYAYVRNNPINREDPNGRWDLASAYASASAKLESLAAKADKVTAVVRSVTGSGSAPTILADAVSGGLHDAADTLKLGTSVASLGPKSDTTDVLIAASTEAGRAGKGVLLLTTVLAPIISMDEAVSKGAAHVDGAGEIETTGKGTNFQFRSTSTNAAGKVESKMARFDVNPNDPHVRSQGPHLNLETHVDGKQTSNPHIPIDPQTIRPGDFP